MTGKPSNCLCRGSWRDKIKRWGVIERRQGMSSRLICHECRWKWWSRRKYVSDIPNWDIRDRSGVCDQDILERLREGTLWVRTETAEVYSYLPPNPGKKLKVSHHRSMCSTYRFVRVSSRGGQKKIALHRLVWMAANLRLVPEGHDIHHRDPKAEPVDGINNLRAVPSAINRSRNVPEGDPF